MFVIMFARTAGRSTSGRGFGGSWGNSTDEWVILRANLEMKFWCLVGRMRMMIQLVLSDSFPSPGSEFIFFGPGYFSLTNFDS